MYPNDLRAGCVRPDFKKRSKSDTSNYCPITLLSAINNIFKKFICAKIHNFYKENNIISKNHTRPISIFFYSRNAMRVMWSNLNLIEFWQLVFEKFLITRIYLLDITLQTSLWFFEIWQKAYDPNAVWQLVILFMYAKYNV